MIPISYNVRNLAVRKASTIAAASGLALVVFVFAATMMLGNGINGTLGRAARSDVAVILQKGAEAEFSSAIQEAQIWPLLTGAEVARRPDGQPDAVAEVSVVTLLPKIDDAGVSNVQIRGVPDGAEAFRPEVKIVEGRSAQPGAGEVIVGKAIRGRFRGLDLGQSFELRKNRPLKVVGVFDAGGSAYDSEAWGDRHLVQAAFGREGLVSAMRVRLASAGAFEALRAAVTRDPKLGLEVLREREYYEKQGAGTGMLIRSLGLMIAVLFSLGAMIGAMITMHATIAHRQREIGTLRALGFSRMSILMSFLLESILLSLAGGAVGALAAAGLSFSRFSLMNFATWSEIVFKFEPAPGIFVGSMVLAAVMGVFGGAFPALRAAWVKPVEAMRN